MKLSLHIALGCAALIALVMTLAFGRQSPAPVIPTKFEDKWSEVPAASKSSKLPTEIRIVKTERIVAPPEPVAAPPTIIPPIVQVQEEPTPKRTRTVSAKRSADICQRHGLRKVQYGKRWRCRR